MPQVATVVRVLVRNVQSDRESLTFSSFSLRELDASNFQTARQSFPGAMQREWLLERHYDAIPPLPAIAEDGPAPLVAFRLTLRIRSYSFVFIGPAIWRSSACIFRPLRHRMASIHTGRFRL
jgi:hypothetical protein